ncbi:hypothetical protein FACS1894111_02430 [Clostridia bacterium]|nr:hypothetical protein FACS1894111_02430 [Clostridia bacterium]
MARPDAEEQGESLDPKEMKAAEKARKQEAKKKKDKKDKADTGGQEEGIEEERTHGVLAVIFSSFFILVIWLGIFGLLIHWDVAGLGSTIFYPVLKNVPYVNRILPPREGEEETVDVQYPYATVEEAVVRIKELEQQLTDAKNQETAGSQNISDLQAQVERLKGFEQDQANFEEMKTKFYREVIFSDNAPDINEYKKYYESIDPANAAELYKQVVQQDAYDSKAEEYAKTYSAMKPKQAAAILEQMTDNLPLAVKILQHMNTDARSAILGAMSPDIAAKLTKLMDPKTP